MKKIGLVTTYRIDNYGTKLQAYAMQKVIERYGFDAEIVDYYPAYDKRPGVVLQKAARKLTQQKKSVKSMDPFLAANLSARHAAISSMDAFYKMSAPIKGYGNLKKCVSGYDGFVCGSDQIWAEGNLITDYYNMAFIDEKKPSIAYAPSFGTESVSAKMAPKYRKMLDSINCISVREEAGVSLVKDLSGKEAALVCDPTILAGREVWDEFASDTCSPETGRYIFCYFLGNNPKHREYAKRAGEELGAKLIFLPHMKGYVPADAALQGDAIYDCTPADFVQYIKGAELVLTDSFHGTVFSIIYNKNFYTFERFSNKDAGSTNNRIYSLTAGVWLGSRIIVDGDEMTFEDISWQKPNEKLQELRDASGQYLEDSFKKTGLLS